MNLVDNYTAEVDVVSRYEWFQNLKKFDDSTIYQTWSYGAIRWGERNLNHLILKKDGEVVAAAQIRIVKLPVLGLGIAYIYRGPIWRVRGKDKNYETFRQMVKTLREEYVQRRKLVLRIVPNEIHDETNEVYSILEQEGFILRRLGSPYMTILIDLGASVEDLRKGLSKKWQENLRRAERNGLEVTTGDDENLYEIFVKLYKEMHARKKFKEFVSLHEFRLIMRDLPTDLKMQIMICRDGNEPVSSLIWSFMGNTGIPIFSATGDQGLKVRGSYLLRWRMLEELKQKGCRYLDQGGVNPMNNPGSYHFKAGMGGKEISYVGPVEACENIASSLAVKSGEKLRAFLRKIKSGGLNNIHFKGKMVNNSSIF